MSHDTTPTLILASASPRRRELLQQMGVRFDVRSASLDETPWPNESPDDYVLRLAEAKAQAVHAQVDSGTWVLGADTAVVVDDQILGKPESRAHLHQMFQHLSGRTHRVLTAVALCGDQKWSCISESRVQFRDIRPQEIDTYWASGEPCDKAGGYAIQGLGAVFVRDLSGSFSGVMGLPVFETAQLFSQAGISFWLDSPDGAY